MRMARWFAGTCACACAIAALAAQAAPAAPTLLGLGPAVTTGAATSVTDTSATLNGTVNPEGQDTTYHFEYGTTIAYGSQTPASDAGAGTTDVNVNAALASLTPSTTYHYRLVGTNLTGTTLGADHTFTTKATPKPPPPPKPPPSPKPPKQGSPGKTGPTTTAKPAGGISLVPAASTITFGQTLLLSGQVLAPRPPYATVNLQTAPSPLGPWANFQITAAYGDGTFKFPGLAPSSNIYYRVAAAGRNSAPVAVLVRFRVGLRVSTTHPSRGSVVRFHGLVAPARGGARVSIQRLGRHGRWVTIRHARLRGRRGSSSYSAPVRIAASGRYRVTVPPSGRNERGYSRIIRIRLG